MSEAAPADSRLVRRLVAVTLLAALLYAAFAFLADVRALQAALEGFALWTLPAALGLVLVGYGFRALRWQLYLRHLGVPSGLGESALVFLSGFAMGVTPGKMGEVVKAFYLRQLHGTSYSASIPAVFAERVSDMVAVALLLAVGLLFAPRAGLLVGALAIGGVLAGLLVLRSARLADLLVRLVARLPYAKRFAGPLGAMHGNLRPLLGGRILAASTILGVVGWALEALAMSVLAHGFGLDLSWGACAFVFSAGSIAGVLSLLPGGLGVTEAGMVGLLHALYDVPLGPAAALTLAIRISTLWFGVGIGVMAIGALRVMARRHQAS